MIDPRKLDEFAQRIQQAMPPGVAAIGDDMRRNLKAAIETAVAQMDLVGREEFDIQAAVLARTREKVSALEERVKKLEEADQSDAPQSSSNSN
ncbi:ubiquinone biosynthesis accessory factor UbiK [Thioalkalivibrio sp. HK1]|uniref:ubiquinone biosynthesis accessory factor UbiK n=1 Tax=Thioalkalivibrio sp. HK1 TaxID=1469245 RepID=UPI00046F87E0|nr:accessory factor UbiK family protein [Thioalkalivibrio sp. HK1]